MHERLLKQRQYPKRLEVFLDYLKLQGSTIEEKANPIYGYSVLLKSNFRVHFQQISASSLSIELEYVI